jgi:hypothetical protein
MLSGDCHCCHSRDDVGGGCSYTPGNAAETVENGEGHGMAGWPVMVGGGGGIWGPIVYRRIPWTTLTRLLRTPLVCSGV